MTPKLSRSAGEGEQPVAFRVSGSGGLLTAMVAALLHDHHPAALIEIDARLDGAPGPGVRVSLSGTPRWLFVSAKREPDASAVEALSEGACAVVTIEADPEEFALAVQALLEGAHSYVPVDMVRWLAEEALAHRGGRQPSRDGAALTAREREILYLVALGCSNVEIARELMISTNTVRTHLHTLSVKLDATSRTKMLANARLLDLREAFGEKPTPGRPSTRVSA